MVLEQLQEIVAIYGQLRKHDREANDLRFQMQDCDTRITKYEYEGRISSHEARLHQRPPSNRDVQVRREQEKKAELREKLDKVNERIGALEAELERLIPNAPSDEEPETDISTPDLDLSSVGDDPNGWLLPDHFRGGSTHGSPDSVGASALSRTMHYTTPDQTSTINDPPLYPSDRDIGRG